MLNIKLTQNIPGSWTHIDVLVDGVKKFHASKQGTDFWIIVDELTKQTIGFGSGKSGVREIVKKHLTLGL